MQTQKLFAKPTTFNRCPHQNVSPSVANAKRHKCGEKIQTQLKIQIWTKMFPNRLILQIMAKAKLLYFILYFVFCISYFVFWKINHSELESESNWAMKGNLWISPPKLFFERRENKAGFRETFGRSIKFGDFSADLAETDARGWRACET